VDAIGKAWGILKKACDLERVVSRLVGVSGGRGRDAADVVLYEDAQKVSISQSPHSAD
jgi:DNA mismatch repair protein MSH6